MGTFYLVETEYLEHHGVKGQKWGVRRDKLLSKQSKNTEKISKYQAKYDKKMAPKRKAKIAKAQYKYDKYTKRPIVVPFLRNSKYRERKERYYKRRLARLNMPADKLNAKIAKLEYKNSKIQKRIDRIDKKIAMSELG